MSSSLAPLMPKDGSSDPIQVLRPGAGQNVAVSGGNAQSAVIGSSVVRLCSTTDCRIAFGSDPTAISTSLYLPAGAVEYFRANRGTDKIGVIQVSAGGTLNIVEMN